MNTYKHILTLHNPNNYHRKAFIYNLGNFKYFLVEMAINNNVKDSKRLDTLNKAIAFAIRFLELEL